MKLFRDPVYGYIEIDDGIVRDVIDAPEFQRLRHIRQTSYAPLYPSALHNRFVHSIGVYYLGKIAMNAVKKSIGEDDEIKKELSSEIVKELFDDSPLDSFLGKMEKSFCIACLLHDVGHSPFSHTGERFFYSISKSSKRQGKDTSRSKEPLLQRIKKAVDSKDFDKDFDEKFKASMPTEHEVMSAIVGIEVFGEQHILDKELFARAIIGCPYYPYTGKTLTAQQQLKNILISLLNSSCIDVDKIDYLLRDAFVTGYDAISIDYKRLLTNIRVIMEDGRLCLAFHKNAVSVLENVVYAHDAERKWIQNHPVIQYESFLLDYAIQVIQKKYKNIFTQKALSREGIHSGTKHICLLCDDDIIHIMKTLDDTIIKEYFDRRARRHPMWKSEAEYKIIFDIENAATCQSKFEKSLGLLYKFLQQECVQPVMDENAVKRCNELSDSVKEDETQQKERYEKIKKILNTFKDVAKDLNIDFNFVVIKVKPFTSNFSKVDLAEYPIFIPSLPSSYNFGRIVPSLNADKAREENKTEFFYMYYKRSLNKCDEYPKLQSIHDSIVNRFTSMSD